MRGRSWASGGVLGVRRNQILVIAALAIILALPSLGLVGLDLLQRRAGPGAFVPPPHPAGVPAEAVFRGGPDGGYFILLRRQDFTLADGRHLPAYRLGAWHESGGAAEYDGPAIFISDPAMGDDGVARRVPPPELTEILDTAHFNGLELRFDIGELHRHGRIIPLDVPD